MAPNDTLPLLLITSCDICGREFEAGEEFYRLQRLQLVAGSAGETPAPPDCSGGQLVCELVSEEVMCAHACGGQGVVKI